MFLGYFAIFFSSNTTQTWRIYSPNDQSLIGFIVRMPRLGGFLAFGCIFRVFVLLGSAVWLFSSSSDDESSDDELSDESSESSESESDLSSDDSSPSCCTSSMASDLGAFCVSSAADETPRNALRPNSRRDNGPFSL
mmetsp:Transcript_12502/g.20798  ORF Transcript_12502/g.20798 Transcript_12502/m.20798 type:complete len:137 (-) Transcript_12502:136-546(-)